MNQAIEHTFGTVTEQIQRARTSLLLHHPFFASLLYKLQLRVAPSTPTMATDGVSLFYNPRFVETLLPEELVGLLAHEVMHPALKHHTRRGTRNPMLWNMACDYVINPIVTRAGMKLPKGVLDNPRYYNMDAESVYALLEQESEAQGSESGGEPSSEAGGTGSNQSGTGSPEDEPQCVETEGGFGQVLDMPTTDPRGQSSEAERRQEEQRWNAAIHEAALTGEMAGRMPAGMKRLVEESAQQRVDWKECLRKSFYSTVPSDYSWTRPNRRFVHMGLYLPGTICEGVGNVVVAVDCSGSISGRTLGMFQSEINGLLEETRPNQVDVLYFDTEVQRVDTYQSGQPITLDPVGGGGTDFNPIFEWIHERGVAPQTLIILTDLWGAFPANAPSYSVIWVSTSSRYKEGPFGDTISIASA
jgi:predicted metal-dependent peptidase